MDGRGDWRGVCERAGVSPALWCWSRRRVLLVAGVLVLAAAACAGSTGVIPWLNRHPKKVEAPSPAPPCRAKNLWVRLDYSVGLNGIDGSFSVANRGRHACSLAGRPRLALIDPRVREPRLLVVYIPPVKPAPGSLANLTPLSLLRAVPPHRGAYLGFSWRNWCGPGPAPKAIELQLPSGDRIVRYFASNYRSHSAISHGLSKTHPRCYRARWQTGLHYGPFYPGWTPKSVLSSYRLTAVLPLRASVITKGLPTVRKLWRERNFGVNNQLHYRRGRYYVYLRIERGSVFRFRVALRNTSRRPFRFTRCPLYQEFIWNPGSPMHEEAFVLNCSPAGTIAPGKAVYFAMQLYVRKDQPLGENFLSWSLVDGNRGNGINGILRPIPVWVVP